MLTDEYRYKIMKQIEANPSISQRELARELDISLGKVNFCLKALVDVGMVKASNFKKNPNKSGYLYLLTPAGIEEKAKVTARFLKRKTEEFDALKVEIENLQEDLRTRT
ncbi:MarR family EPS-associated transcriptional regulator [Salinispirillum sp. LH 10-3-1]|uniref:MarR family EPS-associated transcriptional regulator n=1 Tax=Salinispirillum sp. LH 10-3-1 TaxID=2952525 RepID=A0AB38YJG5_9GAMM